MMRERASMPTGPSVRLVPVFSIFASTPETCARRVRALRGAGETERGSVRR